MMQEEIRQRWLLLVYRVPQDPPGRRTYVWRQMKHLGAVYLQQAAAILPDQPEVRTTLEQLAERIHGFGGEVSLLETISPSMEWEQILVQRFNAARDAEYAELIENVERFENEIDRERRKQRFGFPQLEDIEAEWERLERWYVRIHARDFFAAPSSTAAEETLERGRIALEAFTAEVCAHEHNNCEGLTIPADEPKHETST
jgi:hypothetical protein